MHFHIALFALLAPLAFSAPIANPDDALISLIARQDGAAPLNQSAPDITGNSGRASNLGNNGVVLNPQQDGVTTGNSDTAAEDVEQVADKIGFGGLQGASTVNGQGNGQGNQGTGNGVGNGVGNGASGQPVVAKQQASSGGTPGQAGQAGTGNIGVVQPAQAGQAGTGNIGVVQPAQPGQAGSGQGNGQGQVSTSGNGQGSVSEE